MATTGLSLKSTSGPCPAVANVAASVKLLARRFNDTIDEDSDDPFGREPQTGSLLHANKNAPSEHKVRIEVGYGLEQRLANAVASNIIESIISQFRANDFTTGITHGVDAIIKALSESDDAEMPGNEEGFGPDRWITRRIVASLARSR